MSKITIVLHDLRGGGAEKMMVRLANQLVEDGTAVDMILVTEGGSNKPFLDSAVNLIELKCERTLSAIAPLRNALKISKPDGILSVLTHINIITSITCATLGWLSKLSVSERNAISLDKKVNDSKVMNLTYFIAPYIYRILPNPVIAVSQGVAKDLVDTTVVRNKDVVTAPNPVITAETEKAALQLPTHPWIIKRESKIIVAVGRLAHQKGFDMLIEAFADVRNELDARLIIFGEGELRESLMQQVSDLALTDFVSLPGYTNNPIAEIKHADLYVLSSRFEGSPNGLVEAMSVGTPVVAFDCPHGPHEILKAGKAAPLVEYKNINLLAAEIKKELSKETNGEESSRIKDQVSKFSAKNSAIEYKKIVMREK